MSKPLCHNHQNCIEEALANAQAICEKSQLRLTPLRKQVLTLIWKSHQPVGAYTLIELLASSSGRKIAPPTIYRTLEFLLDVGVIHRINALNAYIGCSTPKTDHPNYFLICTHCQTASECNRSELEQEIKALGQQNGFQIEKQWLEILGTCQQCEKSLL